MSLDGETPKTSSSTVNVTSTRFKGDEEANYELSESTNGSQAPPESPGPTPPTEPILRAPNTLKERLLVYARLSWPSLYGYAERATKYVRGPRPKADLPGTNFATLTSVLFTMVLTIDQILSLYLDVRTASGRKMLHSQSSRLYSVLLVLSHQDGYWPSWFHATSLHSHF